MGNKIGGFLVVSLLVIIFLVVAFSISSVVIYFVWNGLAAYFHFQKVTFWIAVLISIALAIIGGLFKGSSGK